MELSKKPESNEWHKAYEYGLWDDDELSTHYWALDKYPIQYEETIIWKWTNKDVSDVMDGIK